jgi:hypothetical protein
MTVKEAKKQIQEIMKYNYEEFVIALIQIEYNLNENDAINIYNDFMLNDSLTKITQIDQVTESYEDTQRIRETIAIGEFLLKE